VWQKVKEDEVLVDGTAKRERREQKGSDGALGVEEEEFEVTLNYVRDSRYQ